jgi:hypothetical protein
MRQKGPGSTPAPGPGSNATCSFTLVLAHMDMCAATPDPLAGLGGQSWPPPLGSPTSWSILPVSLPSGTELRGHSVTDCPHVAPPSVATCGTPPSVATCGSSGSGSSSSSRALATFSHYKHTDRAAHRIVPVQTSLSLGGSQSARGAVSLPANDSGLGTSSLKT